MVTAMFVPDRILGRLLVPVAALLAASPILAQSQAEQRASQKTEPGAAQAPDGKPAPPPIRIEKPVSPAPPPGVRTARPPGPPLKVTVSPDGQTVYLVGMIFDGSFHQFEAAIRNAPKLRRVHLSSAGGYTIEARLIAALVRKRKLDTYVEFYCASACTQIYAAGRERVLGPNAQLGFHQAVMLDNRGLTAGYRPRTDRKLTSTLVFGVNGNDTLRLAYELAGYDSAFIDKALSFGHENMWLPSPQELLAARAITRIADKSEVAPVAGGTDRETVRSRLLEQPLWRAAQAGMPAVTGKIIDEVWRSTNSGYNFADASGSGRTKLILAGSRNLAKAPDAFLDRSLTLYANSAREQRAGGYPACDKSGSGGKDAATPSFENREDALFIDFLSTEERVPAMDSTEATRVFARDVLPSLSGAYRANYGSDSASKCRLGYQTFEAIDGLPKKTRLRAYRALLSLTAQEPDE